MSESIFPHIKKAVSDFVNDQEGNIPRSKVLMIGSMVLLLGVLLTENAFAAHSSHRSHSSHSSGSGGGGNHSSHVSHTSHTSHTSGGTSSGHSSHSSHSQHSNASHSSHAQHSNATPVVTPRPKSTPTPTPTHENVAPTLEYLNSIEIPAEDTLNLASRLGLIAEGMVPPDTVALGTQSTSIVETSSPSEVSKNE